MSFIGRILWFLFWALILWWVGRLLGRVIGGAGQQNGAGGNVTPRPESSGKRLVKDPICGMHIAEELALPLKANGEVLHFCSEECRTKYENSMVRHAASA